MSRRLCFLVALVTLVTTTVVGQLVGPAAAQQTDKQRQLADQIEETSKAAQQARTQAVEFQAQKAKLDATLGDLESQVAAAQASLAAAQADLDSLNFAEVLLTAKIDKTQVKLADAEADTKKSAVLLYMRPDSTSVLDLIGSADGSGAIVEGKHYLERVSQKRRDDLARSERLRKTLDEQKSDLDAQQAKADATRAEAEATKSRIETLYAQQQSARDAAAQAQAGFESRVQTLSLEQDQLESEKAVEDARIRATIEGAGDGPPMGNGRFLKPVGNAPITSGFGYRTDPITGTSAFHSGLDFGAPCGTPIKAGGNGVVISAGWNGGYGNATIINHGGGLATLYGHQSAFAVGAGQTVTAGQVIGYVGSTGKSTGCHVHFEVRVNGNPVDPTGYL
ncbi:MAG TPA: peptidoglycan DD-metalloendopeptidase family protein [Acidimicrobiia bacterium]|nr:peptidoglycan DD-metalloendopeptidase family protein [Acidimicrobiia bacterium]